MLELQQDCKRVKARILSYDEIEKRFREILKEAALHPLDEESVVKKGGELIILLGLCISQMKAPNSTAYPRKSEHLRILEEASTAIAYKFNTCTVEEVLTQICCIDRLNRDCK